FSCSLSTRSRMPRFPPRPQPPPRSTLFPYTTLFRSLNPLEGNFQHLLGLERAHRAEFFHGITPDPVIQLLDLLVGQPRVGLGDGDRKSTRLNSSHVKISYAVFCLKKKTAIADCVNAT